MTLWLWCDPSIQRPELCGVCWLGTLRRGDAVRRVVLGVLVITVLALGSLGWPGGGDAQGQRSTLEKRVDKLHRAVVWQKRERRQAEHALVWQRHVRAKRFDRDWSYAARLAEAVTGTPAWMLTRVKDCESPSNAKNPHSTASGYMQYLDSTWAGTSLGRAGFSPYDPVAAALAAGRYYEAHRSWSPWTASRGCHGLR